MTSRTEIRISCRRHDWTEALFDGRVREPGFALRPDAHLPLSALVDPAPALDFMECGMMTFVQAAADDGLPILALPIFIRAAFRHSYIFVNANSGIESPRDLEGRRVGTRYEMTANVWARALLRDEYGVRLEKIRWVQQTGNRDGTRFKLPPDTAMEMVGPDVDLQDWLAAGKIDALIHPDILPLKLLSRGPVRRLFADAAAEERKSYARIGIVPVMNVIAFRRAEEPASVRRVFDTFARAKEAGLDAMEDNRASGLLWYWKAWEDQVALLGRDPVPYSLAKMRPTVDAFIGHAVAQGLLEKPVPAASLFADL
ncbi:MAG TPA: PhnD/SsuA/transferrin family substrate-binding protein [Stellaceae bacterium]|nr:PhnD/SsuA/transferrin family substrate-binding protein [Stellaceae bacterium]